MKVDIANLGLSSFYNKGDLISKLLMVMLFSLTVITLFSVSSIPVMAGVGNLSISNISIITDAEWPVHNMSRTAGVIVRVYYNESVVGGAASAANNATTVNMIVTEPDGDQFRCTFRPNVSSAAYGDVFYNGSADPCYQLDDTADAWEELNSGTGDDQIDYTLGAYDDRGHFDVMVVDDHTAHCSGNNSNPAMHAGLCDYTAGNRSFSSYWINAQPSDIVVRTNFDNRWLLNKTINGTTITLRDEGGGGGGAKQLTDGSYTHTNGHTDVSDGFIVFPNSTGGTDWVGSSPGRISTNYSYKSGFTAVYNYTNITSGEYNPGIVNDLYTEFHDIEFGVGNGDIGIRVIDTNANDLTGVSLVLFNGTAVINQTAEDPDNDGYIIVSNDSWKDLDGDLAAEELQGHIFILSVTKTGFSNITEAPKWNMTDYSHTAPNYGNITHGRQNVTLGANIQVTVNDWAGSGLVNVSIDLKNEAGTTISSRGNTSSSGVVTFTAGVNFTTHMIYRGVHGFRELSNDTFTVSYSCYGFQNNTAETSSSTAYTGSALVELTAGDLGADINVTVNDWTGMYITGAEVGMADNVTRVVTDGTPSAASYDGDSSENGVVHLVATYHFNYTQVSGGYTLNVSKSGYQGGADEAQSAETYSASAINSPTVDLGTDINGTVRTTNGSLMENATVYLLDMDGAAINSTLQNANPKTNQWGNYTFIAGRDFTKAQMCGASCDVDGDAEFMIGASKSMFYGGMRNYTPGLNYMGNTSNVNSTEVVLGPDILFTLVDWSGNPISGAQVGLYNKTSSSRWNSTVGNGTYNGNTPFNSTPGVYRFVSGVHFHGHEINASSSTYNITYKKAGFRGGLIGDGNVYNLSEDGSWDNRTEYIGADIQVRVLDWAGNPVKDVSVNLINVSNDETSTNYEFGRHMANQNTTGLTNSSGYVYFTAGDITTDVAGTFNFSRADINPTSTDRNRWNATFNRSQYHGSTQATFNSQAYSASGLNTYTVYLGGDIIVNVTGWGGNGIRDVTVRMYNGSDTVANVTGQTTNATGLLRLEAGAHFTRDWLCPDGTCSDETFYIKINKSGFEGNALNTSAAMTYDENWANSTFALNNITASGAPVSGSGANTYEVILGSDINAQINDWDSNGINGASVYLYFNKSGTNHLVRKSTTVDSFGNVTFVAGTDFNFTDYSDGLTYIIGGQATGFAGEIQNASSAAYDDNAVNDKAKALGIAGGNIGAIVMDWENKWLLNQSGIQVNFTDAVDADYKRVTDGGSGDLDSANNGRIITSGTSGWSAKFGGGDGQATEGENIYINSSSSAYRANSSTHVINYQANGTNYAVSDIEIGGDVSITITFPGSVAATNVTVHLWNATDVIATLRNQAGGVYTFTGNKTGVSASTNGEFNEWELGQDEYMLIRVDESGDYGNKSSENRTYNISKSVQPFTALTMALENTKIVVRQYDSYTTGYAGGDYETGWYFNFTVWLHNGTMLRWTLADWTDSSGNSISVNTSGATLPLDGSETNAYMHYYNTTGANSTYFIGNGWDEQQVVTPIQNTTMMGAGVVYGNATIWMKLPSGTTAGQYWTSFRAGLYK